MPSYIVFKAVCSAPWKKHKRTSGWQVVNIFAVSLKNTTMKVK